MSNRLLSAALGAALVALAFVVCVVPASAAQLTLRVRLVTGQIVTVTVDAPCVPISQMPGLPGTPIATLTPPGVCSPQGTPTVPTTPAPSPTTPTSPTTPQQPPQNQGSNGGNGGGGGQKDSGGGSRGEPRGRKGRQ